MMVVALHGFLGLPADWQESLATIESKIESKEDTKGDFDLLTPDLSVWATRAEITNLASFAHSFNRAVRKRMEETQDKVILAGYSMGGRLAIQCLFDDPDLYAGAVLVSTHFGLDESDRAGREARVSSDQAWAERLRKNAWEKSWSEWNAQPVLRPGTRARSTSAEGSVRGSRLEGRREAWARALEMWSLGRQDDFRDRLKRWTEAGKKLTVLSGTDDAKFTELATQWTKSVPSKSQANVRHRTVLGAGHRVLLEAPEDVAQEVANLASQFV